MKQRLDLLLVQRGLVESREKAKALIMEGRVYSNETRLDKAGSTFDESIPISIREQLAYVSRGGIKLKKAISVFSVELEDCICADIGASTGGFSDCMLQHGAAKVYAVDVGYGQLAWKLRSDQRVVVLERTNARHLSSREIPEKLDFFSVDVSFISLKLILPALVPLLSEKVRGVALIKPQFEAGRDRVGKNGVVRDPDVHVEVIEKVFEAAVNSGLHPIGLDFSPIKGPKGNIEYLMLLAKQEPLSTSNLDLPAIPTIVQIAHETLHEKKGG